MSTAQYQNLIQMKKKKTKSQRDSPVIPLHFLNLRQAIVISEIKRADKLTQIIGLPEGQRMTFSKVLETTISSKGTYQFINASTFSYKIRF